MSELKEKNRIKFFPYSKDAMKVLHEPNSSDLPVYYRADKNSEWTTSSSLLSDFMAKIPVTNNAVNDPEVKYTRDGKFLLIRIINTNLHILNESFDHLLGIKLAGALNISRQAGQEKISVTSLGRPDKTDSHTDSYGRFWKIRRFNIMQGMIFYFAFLDTPEGISGLGKTGYLMRYNDLSEIKFMTDFCAVPLHGSAEQWAAFLMLPENRIDNCSVTPGSKPVFRCNYIEFSPASAAVFEAAKIFSIWQACNLMNPEKLSVWRMGIRNEENQTGFFIRKMDNPLPEAPVSYTNIWVRASSAMSPWDGKTMNKKGQTCSYFDVM
ncbi:MAG TPA: hypothetical protein DC049_05260, partial [Spirochaetia bacterium]|nr:hypothetical protein [Spirochaetia bacterium]